MLFEQRFWSPTADGSVVSTVDATCAGTLLPMWEMLQRVLRRGPKYGIARGVVVYGPGSGDPTSLQLIMRPSASFRSWASGQGVTLTDTAESLVAVEDRLDEWLHSALGPRLTNEVGRYLGSVIVANLPGARWVAWPNGHPVVRLPSGSELDTTAIVADRLATGVPTLTRVFAEATA